jgi:hypothetical protein
MLKKIFLSIVMVMSFFAHAVSDSTSTSIVSSNSAHRKKKVELEFLLASEQTKNSDNEVSGYYNKLDGSFLYSFDQKNDLRFFLSTIYLIEEEMENEFNWELAEVMWRRKSLLGHKKHGIRMDLEMKYYQFLDSSIKERYRLDGAFVPQLVFKKKWSRYFSTELKLRRHFFDRNDRSASTLAKEDRIYLTPSYMYAHRFLFYTQFTYKHKMRAGDYFSYRTFSEKSSDQELYIVQPSVMYFFSRKVLGEVYLETKFKNSDDDRTVSETMSDEQVFGAALYILAI